jgi:phage gp45-like
MTAAPTRWILVAVLAFAGGALAMALLYRSGDSATSTNQGSGVPATQTRNVAGFDSVELAGANNVVIHVGGKQSVVVRADDNLLDRVTTEVQAGTLVVANTAGSFTTTTPMRVDVTVPALGALTLSGAGNMVVDGVDAESLEASLPGSGTLTGSGSATRLDVSVAGSGTVQFTRLVASDVRASVSGSGSILVTATDRLDASVPGSGTIVYGGSPQDVTKNVSGNGAITGS